MTASFRHWQTFTSGVPRSPIFPRRSPATKQRAGRYSVVPREQHVSCQRLGALVGTEWVLLGKLAAGQTECGFLSAFMGHGGSLLQAKYIQPPLRTPPNPNPGSGLFLARTADKLFTAAQDWTSPFSRWVSCLGAIVNTRTTSLWKEKWIYFIFKDKAWWRYR